MSQEKQKLANKVFLAARDMGEVGDYLWSLREVERNHGNLSEYRLKKAMDAIIIAAIVVYVRHFKKTLSNGNASKWLDPNDINLFDGRPDLAELHEKILEIRDQAVAHADWTYHPTSLVQSDDDCLGFSREFNRVDYRALIDIAKFQALIDHNWKVISDSACYRDFNLANEFGWRGHKI